MVSFSAVVCLSLLAFAEATEVRQCKGQSLANLKDLVKLSPCQKPPCLLKKGTKQFISINFTPDTDVDEVKNRVTADVLGVDFPFIGVDGGSICDKVFTPDDAKASCPLKAGTEYVYKDAFPVMDFYPTLKTKVHWALQHNSKDMICFEVPVKITA